MNELIKIEERNGEQLVSARELHKFLKVTERFQQWIDKKQKNIISQKIKIIQGVNFLTPQQNKNFKTIY